MLAIWLILLLHVAVGDVVVVGLLAGYACYKHSVLASYYSYSEILVLQYYCPGGQNVF